MRAINSMFVPTGFLLSSALIIALAFAVAVPSARAQVDSISDALEAYKARIDGLTNRLRRCESVYETVSNALEAINADPEDYTVAEFNALTSKKQEAEDCITVLSKELDVIEEDLPEPVGSNIVDDRWDFAGQLRLLAAGVKNLQINVKNLKIPAVKPK